MRALAIVMVVVACRCAAADPASAQNLPAGLAAPANGAAKPIESPARGALLPALYASFVALEAYDAYSTHAGLARGRSEANPLMRTLTGGSVAMWTVKMSATATTMYLTERLWRQHRRRQAVVVMLVSNGIAAAVAAHNAAVLRRQP